IDASGVVGPIGGIQQKILGAEDSGASVFLVPAANCIDAQAAGSEDMTLVRVETLAGAVDALDNLADDPAAAVPTC
nr:hypothetical protein [Micromonospora sp. DSM 115978]